MEEKLRNEARLLHRGCREHFRGSVSRISHDGWYISPSSQLAFENLAARMCDTPSSVEYRQIVSEIQQRWPNTKTWMAWWIRPDNSRLIMQSQMEMTAELQIETQASTNGEEALHHVIYLSTRLASGTCRLT